MGVSALLRSVLAFALAITLTACAPSAANQSVTSQNAANTQAHAANIALLSAATRDLAAIHTAAILQQARERIATDLTRLHLTITPTTPTDAELSDPAAPWSRALAAESAALAARLNIAPPGGRPRIAEDLADAHPATIDLALAAPGFTAPRILHDAVALDTLNTSIDAEPSPPLRAALLAQRNALLDPYLPARLAQQSAAQYLAALDQLISTTTDQSTIAQLHAGALSRATTAPPLSANPIVTFQNPALRAAILDLVAHEWGQPSADQLRTRLSAIDAALNTLAQAPPH